MIGWIPADWPAPGGIIAGVSTREGGASCGPKSSLNLGLHVDDLRDAVLENRQRLESHLALAQSPMWLNQVHSTALADARQNEEDTPTADAAVSAPGHRALAIMSADCLPILFCTRDGKRIAAAHAGWRGLAGGVIDVCYAALAAPADTILAWLGPAISQAAYEVGDDVRAAFVTIDEDLGEYFVRNERDRWQADLYGIARHQLRAVGITAIYGGDWCTYTERERFFSHRRNPATGRLASVIGFAAA